MNIYLLQVVAKWFHLLIISIISIFGNTIFNLEVYNVNNNKSLNIINTIVEHQTVKKYNSKLPYNVTNILVEGIDGLVYKDENGTTVNVIREKVDQVVEIGTGKYGEYKGVMTVYGPDCSTCDGRGILYCSVGNNKWHNLIKDGIHYDDKEYGKVRIIAADHREFPCGTIIEINNSNFDNMIVIVLDTGSGMRKAYDEGWILMDLAFETEKNIPIGTNRNTSFSVKRWGW